MSLGDVLIRLCLIHLQYGADVTTYVDVSDVDGEDLEGGTGVEPLLKHQLRDRVRILEDGRVSLSGADARHDALSDASEDGLLASTTDQLRDISPHGDARLGDQLDAVLGHSGDRRGVDHLRIHAHLDRLKDVTPGEVDRSSIAEAQVDPRLIG